MIISEKQIMMMYQVLVDSLGIVGSWSPFKFDSETRKQLVNDILNQQSKELKVIE